MKRLFLRALQELVEELEDFLVLEEDPLFSFGVLL